MQANLTTDSIPMRLARWLYPAQCGLCGVLTDEDGMLCPSCWADMVFLTGSVCSVCGAQVPGEAFEEGVTCDDCLASPRPWSFGRAAIAYADSGRRLVLGLKHGDRLDLVPLAARWMHSAGQEILTKNPLLVPIPIARRRLIRRRYNQSAELARAVGKNSGCDVVFDALIRRKAGASQDGLSVQERFANVCDAFEICDKRRETLRGRHVVVIDDVMTSGATLSEATRTLLSTDVASVSVLVLARAQKAP